MNHRKAIGESDIISSECKRKAKTIVTAVDDTKDMTVAVFTLTEDIAALMKTALNPKPEAAMRERNIPVINLCLFPYIVDQRSKYKVTVNSTYNGITTTFWMRHHA